MVDTPNPNDPGQNPNPQINLSDVMNTAKFQQELSALITSAFSSAGEKASQELFSKIEQAETRHKETQKKGDSDVAKARLAFVAKVASAERAAYHKHLDNSKKELDLLKAQGYQSSDISKFKQASAKIGSKLYLEAEAAEGSHLAKTKLAMMEKVEAASKYNFALAAAGGLWTIIALAIQRAIGFSADLAKEQAALNAGGVTVKNRENLFSKIPTTILGAQERVEAGTELAKAPKALETSPEDLKRYIGVFGNIIPDMKQLIGLFGDASHAQNLGANDLVKVFKLTKPAYAGIKVDQREMIKTSLMMSESLRGITTNATLANRVLDMMSGPLEKIGASPEEISRFNGAMAGFLGNLSFEQLTGLGSFVNGGEMPTDAKLKTMLDDPIDTVIGAFSKIEQQLPDPTRKLIALEQVTKQFGMNLNPRGVMMFGDLLKDFQGGKIKKADFDTKVKGYEAEFGKGMEAEIARGFAQIAKSDGLIKIFERLIDNLMVRLGTPLLGEVGKIADVAANYDVGRLNPSSLFQGTPDVRGVRMREEQTKAQQNISETLRSGNGSYQVGK